MSKQELTLSVIIVNFNSLDYLSECLNGLNDIIERHELIVVDNHGADGVQDFVYEFYPKIRFVPFEKNSGFGGGCNRGASIATGNVLAMLNPDTVAKSEDLIYLANSLIELDLAACGPQLLNSDHSHQVGDAGWRPTITSVASHSFLLHRLCERIPALYLTNPRLLKTEFTEVDWVSGACLLTTHEQWRAVGGFDERIFMYGEDIDLCLRLKMGGRSIGFIPKVRVLHHQGASQKVSGSHYYSEKWLSAMYKQAKDERNRAYASILLAVLSAGFLLQAFVLALLTVKNRDANLKLNASHKYKYACAALRLIVHGAQAKGERSVCGVASGRICS